MSIDLNASKTALVLIDLQNGIVGMNLAPHDSAEVVARSVALGQSVAAAGGLIVLVNVRFSPDGADRPNQNVDAPMASPPGGLPAGWSDFAPELAALPDPLVVTKRQWGAFFGTELDLQLRRRGITTIVLAGIATNFGVESTAREAWQHNYDVVVAEDACTSMSAELHAFSIGKIMPRIAKVRTTAEIFTALG